MNFFTHKIANPAGSGPTFEEWLSREVAKYAQENKIAGEAKPECGDDPRGQCRGQVINTDNEDGAGYQKGESVSGKKEQGGNARPDAGGKTDTKENKQKDKEAKSEKKTVEAKCGKEMGESGDAGKVTDKHTDAGPGDDEHPEPKTLINDDPNYQKGESTDPAKATGKSKKGPNDPVVGKGKKKASVRFKKIASLEHNDRLSLFASLSSEKRNILNTIPTISPLAYIEAMSGIKFANMKEDEKKWFKDFWTVLYPPEYVDQMVKDR